MKAGIYQRSKPRVNVLRGFYGNESLALTFSAPIAAGVTIYSGQIISLDSSGNWILGAAAGTTPYVAYSDSVDTDVVSSGTLLGLSCSGKYEIETAYLETGTYNQDTPIAAHATNGNIKVGVIGTDQILGQASRGGKRTIGPVVTLPNGDLIANGGTTSQAAGAISVVAFVTNFQLHGV